MNGLAYRDPECDYDYDLSEWGLNVYDVVERKLDEGNYLIRTYYERLV